MTIKSILSGLTFGTSISVVSWMIGIIFNGIFGKTKLYETFGNLNFIKSKSLNKKIGMKYFKWIVVKSLFRFLNQKIRIENKNSDLNTIRAEMTLAEISHLVGFIFVSFFALYFSFRISLTYGLTIMIPNTILNLYPSLLQQENKRRMDTLIKKQNNN
jgi:cytochrome b561